MIFLLDNELETLGRRLEASRNSLEIARNSQSAWAQRHWQENYDYLLRRWDLLVAGHRRLTRSYSVRLNWLIHDGESEFISWLDRQLQHIYERISGPEFHEDLNSVAEMQQALAVDKP